jgi:hypothetical protein
LPAKSGVVARQGKTTRDHDTAAITLFVQLPQYLVGLVFFGEQPQEQQDVKKEALEPDEKGAQIRGPERTAVRMDINFLGEGTYASFVQQAVAQVA